MTAAALGLQLLLVLPGSLGNESELKMLVVRSVALAATGGLGSLYWRIVRRRGATSGARDEHPAAPPAWHAAGVS